MTDLRATPKQHDPGDAAPRTTGPSTTSPSKCSGLGARSKTASPGRGGTGQDVSDFGCGTGTLLQALVARSQQQASTIDNRKAFCC